MKQCSKCKIEKPFEQFHVSNNRKHVDGLQGYCKECAKAYRREYYQEYKELFRQEIKMRMQDPDYKVKIRRQQREANQRWRDRQKAKSQEGMKK
jgi:hypothetical protein